KDSLQMPKTLAAALATAALLVASAVLPSAQAESAHPGKQPRPSSFRVLLNFDNRPMLKSNTLVRDASGHKHAAKVVVEGAGRIRLVNGVRGKAASFPKLCHGCGHAIIELADRRGLDPNGHAFAFGAAIRVSPAQTRHGENVFQKGYYNEAGG